MNGSTAPAPSDVAADLDPRGWFVYLLWGDDPDRPLYVGGSTNVLGRVGAHLTSSGRRPYSSRVTLIRCSDREHMIRTEAALIREHQPPWNTTGTGRCHYRRTIGAVRRVSQQRGEQ